MKRSLFTILFIGFFALISFGQQWKYTPKQQSDSLSVTQFFKLNGEVFKLTNPTNGQILRRVNGRWINVNPMTLAFDSIKFNVSSGYFNMYKDGSIVLSTSFDGRYVKLEDMPIVPTSIWDLTGIDRTGWQEGKLLKFDANGNVVVGSLTGTPSIGLTDLSAIEPIRYNNATGAFSFNMDTIPVVYPWALASTKPTYQWSEIQSKPNFATVATTGDYNNLINKPAASAPQVNSDWNATYGPAKILNKPDLIDTIYVVHDTINNINYVNYVIGGVTYNITSNAIPEGRVYGGIVTRIDSLKFDVTPTTYYIGGKLYTTTRDTLILDDPDLSNPRIDIIGVDTTGVSIVIKGTPNANPQKPSVNPLSQVELTQVLVMKDSVAVNLVPNDQYEYWGLGVNNGSARLIKSHESVKLYGLNDGIEVSRIDNRIYFKADTTKLATQYDILPKITKSDLSVGANNPASGSGGLSYNNTNGVFTYTPPLLFSGSYTDLTNKPILFDGNYNSLTNKPTLFDGAYSSLTGKPTLFSGSYNDLTNKPTLFDGNYNSLTNKPTLFDGAYSSLTGKPTLLSQFTNDPGFLTSYTETDPTIYAWAKASSKPSYSYSEIGAQAPLVSGTNIKTINGTSVLGPGNISISGGNAINAFYNQIAVTSNPISVTWPSSMGDTNYFLNIRAWYDKTVSGKTVQIANAVYDFTKTANGFSLSLDTIAGYVEYFAADTTNLYPMSFSNYLTPNDVVTTVGNPGADNKVPSEQAVREALSSFVATETDPVYTASSWHTTTNNSSNWNTAFGWGNHASAGYWSTSNHPTTTVGYGLPDYPTSLPASDVYSWAKAATKPSYTYTEVGAQKPITLTTNGNSGAATFDGETLNIPQYNGGTASAGIWTALTGTYASATTFTFSGTDTDAKMVEMSLLTCTNSTGATRRIGYVKSATNSSGTITCNVVTDTDLASGDKDFKIAYNRKVTDYMRLITIPGECIADASYSQGMFYPDIPVASYLLPVDASVLTAAAGTGAALTWNVYKGATNLFSSAPDMTTNTVLRSQRPTTNTISAADNVSLRILTSAGATNKAADFQAKLYIVPQSIWTAFGFNWILIIGLISVAMGGSLLSFKINKKLIVIVILFCSTQVFGQIKGYWRLNGNSNDASVNGNNGTDTNIAYSNSIFNQGATFDGYSSFIFLGNIAFSNTFTVEAFVNISNFNTYNTILNRGINIYRSIYFDIRKTTGKVYCGFTISSANHRGAESSSSVELNKWFYVAGSYDGSKIKVYINGVKKGEYSYSGSRSDVDGLWSGVLYESGAYSQYFNGSIDELKLHNIAMPESYFKNQFLKYKGFF